MNADDMEIDVSNLASESTTADTDEIITDKAGVVSRMTREDFLAGMPRKYTADITASQGATIAAATHGLGATKALMIQIFEDGTPNNLIEADISVADNGDVTWATTSDLTGHIVIIG